MATGCRVLCCFQLSNKLASGILMACFHPRASQCEDKQHLYGSGHVIPHENWPGVSRLFDDELPGQSILKYQAKGEHVPCTCDRPTMIQLTHCAFTHLSNAQAM